MQLAVGDAQSAQLGLASGLLGLVRAQAQSQ